MATLCCAAQYGALSTAYATLERRLAQLLHHPGRRTRPGPVGDLEAAFEMGGVAHNPPLALIRAVLVRCGAPAWVWEAEAKLDQAGVMFRRVSGRSAA